MQRAVDEATGRFLEAARADMQRHLGSAGEVETVTTAQSASGVVLVAWVRLGARRVTFAGSGESLVAAFGALTRAAAAPATDWQISTAEEVRRGPRSCQS